MDYKLYIVGGYVRDKLLGIESKDIDYAFEFSRDYIQLHTTQSTSWFYEKMNTILREEGFEIFLETPSCFTTRAKFPKGHGNEGLTADFVMCRKETYPDQDSRQPLVTIGNLLDDLTRRDFKVNAMALTDFDILIDPFKGQEDLKKRVLSCPVDAHTSFMDDPLRIIRALRFAVTKGFTIDEDCIDAMKDPYVWIKFDKVVSRERVREELLRMFKFDTFKSINTLNNYVFDHYIKNFIFKDDIWLKPTTEK